MPAPTSQPVIVLRLFVSPHALRARRVIPIIMILVNRRNHLRRIHHRRAFLARLPHEPVIPPHPPDHQRRHLCVQPTPERKVIQRPSRLLHTTRPSHLPDARTPRRVLATAIPPIAKPQRLAYPRIPPPPHHQKPLMS